MKQRIVVVDDDANVLSLMQAALGLEGYGVHTCSTATDLCQLLADPPGLIILDVFLKGGDGREVCRRLKQKEHTQQIPIILYSAYLRADEVLQASRADDFLAKPFHLQDLLAKVAQYLPAPSS